MIAQISSIEVEEQISPGANSPCGDGSYPMHSGPKIPMIERPPANAHSDGKGMISSPAPPPPCLYYRRKMPQQYHDNKIPERLIVLSSKTPYG